MHLLINRELPEVLHPLASLAMDLRWTGSQTASRIWARLDADMWERTRNPLTILLNVHWDRLEAAAPDPAFRSDLDHMRMRIERANAQPSWFATRESAGLPNQVAYFSMEFGLDGGAADLFRRPGNAGR